MAPHASRHTSALPSAGVVHVPVRLSRGVVTVQAAPAARPEQGVVRSGGPGCGGSHASVPVPEGPLPQVPVIVPRGVVTVQAAPAARLAQASIASCGGVRTRSHASVVPPGGVAQTPVSGSSRSPSLQVQASPAALPLQASIAACGGEGGAGGVGAQASALPSTVVAQVPDGPLPPSPTTNVQVSPAALPVQASSCACDGVHDSAPLAVVVLAVVVLLVVVLLLLLVALLVLEVPDVLAGVTAPAEHPAMSAAATWPRIRFKGLPPVCRRLAGCPPRRTRRPRGVFPAGERSRLRPWIGRRISTR